MASSILLPMGEGGRAKLGRMRVGWWVTGRDPPLTLSRKNDGFAAVRSSPLPMGEGSWEPVLTDPDLINGWIGGLIDAVEAAGPQRLEVKDKRPMIVLPLDTYRTLAGYRPSFIDMLRDFGFPDSELASEQEPFNVAGRPVPHKY